MTHAKKIPAHIRFAALAVDGVAFAFIDGVLHVRTAEVQSEAFRGMRGFPGGMIHADETAEQALVRIMREKAAVTESYSEQLYTFSRIDRDPRGRVVAVAYLLLVNPVCAQEIAKDACGVHKASWTPLSKAKKFAYDHDEVLVVALERLRAKIAYTDLMRHLMPKEFTLTELQSAFESILGRGLDKRNFRKKVLALNLVEGTSKKTKGGAFRPAELYRFGKRIGEVEIF
ncbi:MAG: NUDIX domain-containing protein [Patescibacteria group bacterium]